MCSLSDDTESVSVKAHFGYTHMYVTNFKNLHTYTQAHAYTYKGTELYFYLLSCIKFNLFEEMYICNAGLTGQSLET